MALSDLQATILAELMRVIGDDGTTGFYTLVPDDHVTEAQAAEVLAQLRRLPSGLGFDEVCRRLGNPPPLPDAEP